MPDAAIAGTVAVGHTAATAAAVQKTAQSAEGTDCIAVEPVVAAAACRHVHAAAVAGERQRHSCPKFAAVAEVVAMRRRVRSAAAAVPGSLSRCDSCCGTGRAAEGYRPQATEVGRTDSGQQAEARCNERGIGLAGRQMDLD